MIRNLDPRPDRNRSRPSKVLDLSRLKDTISVWIVGGSAVVAIALAGWLIRAKDALMSARVSRDDRMPDAPKRPVSSVRKALDRYGR